jgi:hypothetical protein
MAAKRRPRANAGGTAAGTPRVIGSPLFAQPQPTADPKTFRIPHASDKDAYAALESLLKAHKLKALPFPLPRGGIEPRLTLDQVLGGDANATKAITTRGQIVFHALGDCGSTRGPATETLVADKLLSDFHEMDPKEVPQFNLLLGDIVYSFGEAQYYYDQFYEPYRDYPAPILAVAGNHDGIVAPGAHVKSLDAFLRNFCSKDFVVAGDAGGLSRTAQIQPGVFFTFEAPFVRVLALYSNMLEDPGVISSPEIGDSQIKFLDAALERVKSERYAGALLIAHHHPPYVASAHGGRHSGSPDMLAQIDEACTRAGVWPHAVLAGHVHNYQRFTRIRRDGTEIPYASCGNGGHNAQAIKGALRTPQVIQSTGGERVVLENYDAAFNHYGYLRVIATAKQLRIEYHPAGDGAASKTPDDSVTIDLATRKRAFYPGQDLGVPQMASTVRRSRPRK